METSALKETSCFVRAFFCLGPWPLPIFLLTPQLFLAVAILEATLLSCLLTCCLCIPDHLFLWLILNSLLQEGWVGWWVGVVTTNRRGGACHSPGQTPLFVAIGCLLTISQLITVSVSNEWQTVWNQVLKWNSACQSSARWCRNFPKWQPTPHIF